MASNVPDRIGPRDLVQTARAARVARGGEMDVFRHAVRTWVESQKDQIDTEALQDVLTCAADAEIDFYDDEMEHANNSDVKQEIVLRKLALFNRINDRRIERKFGRRWLR